MAKVRQVEGDSHWDGYRRQARLKEIRGTTYKLCGARGEEKRGYLYLYWPLYLAK